MNAGTVKTVGIVLILFGALFAMGGAFIPDIELGGSATGGGAGAEGDISVGFGSLLWVGIAIMAVGLVLAIAGLYAPQPAQNQRPRDGDEQEPGAQ